MKHLYLFAAALLAFALSFLMPAQVQAQTIWDGTADTTWYDASLSSFDISTPEQLAGLALLVNTHTNSFSGKTLNLTNDIWLNSTGDSTNNWIPIGGSATATSEPGDNTGGYAFKGTFNGHGYSIYNLYCDKSNNMHVGLFGRVQNPCTIDSVVLMNPVFKGKGMMGSITGLVNDGGNVYIRYVLVVNARIVGTSGNNIGGIVGASYPNNSNTYIQNCGVTGQMSGNYIGGIGGNAEREYITNCYFAGDHTPSNTNHGGITSHGGNRTNCYSYVNQLNSQSQSSASSDGNAVTQSYMQSSSIINDLGSAFKMDFGINNGYPIMSYMPGVDPMEVSICTGESTTLTACGYDSYLWSNGATSASITVSPTTTTVYTVTGTNLSGATGVLSSTVTVYPQAVITATAVANPDGQVHGTVTPASSTVPCGSSQTVTLTITPDAGWHIALITKNGDTLRGEDPTDGSVVTYVVDPMGTLADIKVFFSNIYHITASTILNDGTPLNVSGLVSPWGTNGVYNATQGNSVTYTFNETARYHLMDVEIDNISQGAVTTYTFSSVAEPHTIVVTYGDCAPVTNLTVSQVSGTSAMISWADGSAGAAQDYTLEWRDTTQGTAWNTEYNITGTSYLLGNLTPLTDYEVRVQSNCNNNLQGGWVTKSFHTPCLVGGDIQIGNGTSTTSYFPSYNFYNYSLTEQIFTAAELGGANTFHSISFQASSVNAATRTWSIYLMPTTATSLSGFVNVDATAQQVFNGTANISQGWFTIQFDNNYVYDGTTNLMLIVDDNTGSYVSSNSYYYTDNPNGSSIRVYSDGTNYDPLNATSYSGTTYAYRNNVIFGGACDSTTTCVAPNLMVTGTTESTIDITWVPGYSETSWDLEYKPVADTIWDAQYGLTGNTYTITGLNPNTEYQVRLQAVCGSDWRTVTARTACGAISIPYSEDFETGIVSTSQDNYILCWSRLANSTSHWAYVGSGSSSAHSGNRYMDFHYTPDCYTMAITPTIDNSYPVNTLMVEFYARHNGAAGIMEVGVISDINDGTTFEAIDTLEFTATSTYEHFIVSFENYSGSGQNIAFRASNGTSVSFMMDDLIITEIPTCMHPNNLVSTGTGSDYVTLNWTEMGDATSWIIEYGPTGFVPGQGNGTTETASTHPYTVQNLTSGVSYDFYVQADCGSMTSDLVGPVTVVTGQFIMQNANDTLTTCGAVIYDNGGPNGDYSANSNNTLVLIPATPGSMMMLTGTCNVENSWDHLYIYDGVGTSGTQLASLGNSSTQNVSVLSTTGPLTIHFTSDGSVQKFGFELFASCESCFPPSGITASNVTTSTADLTWSGISSEYIVTVTGPDTTVLVVYDTTVTLTNLTASSSYRVVINSVCGSDTSFASSAYTFNTSCGAITITEAIPWTEDFESFPHSGGARSFVCWDTPVTYVADNGTAPFVYCGHVPSCHSGTNSAEFKGNMNMLVLPEFTNDIHDLRLSFWATACSSSGGHTDNGVMEVGVITNITDTSTFEFVAFTTRPSDRNGIGNYLGPFDFNGVTATSGRIALRYTNTAATESWNLDDFIVQIAPNCPSPVKNSVTATNVGTYDADISWTDNDPTHTSWTIYYKESSDSVWYTSSASTNPAQLTGLNAETSYDVYVISNCATSDLVPDATFTISFTTLPSCPTPTAVNVTDATPASVTLAWTEHGTATEWEIEYGPANFTHGNGTIVSSTTNPFDVTGLVAGTTYKFYVRGICGVGDTSAYSSSITYMVPFCNTTDQCNYVFHLTDSYGDGWNGNTINVLANGVQVASVTMSSGSSADVTVPLCDNSALSLSWSEGSYAYETSFTIVDPFGDVIYTCTSGSSLSGTFYTDVVSCTPVTCPRPSDFVSTGTTSTSATFSWIETGTATSWEIEYGAPGFAPGTGVGTTVAVSTNPFEVTGLTTSTAYDFYIRSICGAGDESTWRGPVSATPGSFVMPAMGAVTVTTCDMTIYDNGGATGQYTSYCDAVVIINPATPGSMISITGTVNTETNYDELEIYDGAGVSGTPAQVISGTGQTVNFTSTTGPATIHFTSDGSVFNDGFVLHVSCAGDTSVVAPTVTTNDATNIAQTSATLNGAITPGSESITAQGFEWKISTGGAYTQVSVAGTTLSHNLTGLTANTSYTFRAFATTASGTTYGADKTFTTLDQGQEACPAPTDVQVSNITANSADISWVQPNNAATSWDIQYKENGATSWNSVTTSSNPHTLSGLQSETIYLVQVIAHCDNDQTSVPSALVTLTTVGIEDHELNSVMVYPNPTRGTVQVQDMRSTIQQVMVYDAYGKMLSSVEVGGNSATLDLSGYAEGIYFMKVQTDIGIVTKRVVKQ